LFQQDSAAGAERLNLVFACRAENDVSRLLAAEGRAYPRFPTAAEAVAAAPEASGVLVLADGYPARTTPIDQATFDAAARKRLRLYLEYPSLVPGMQLGPPRRVQWERTVVTSDRFGPSLGKMRILAIHECHFLPVAAERTHMVAARVAGFDTAVFGLPKDTWPILFEHPRGDLLVSTTRLSQFVTSRYAPSDAWPAVWRMILGWLAQGKDVPELKSAPTVRASFGRRDPLPADAQLQAMRRGVTWYERARLLVHPSWKDKVLAQPEVAPAPSADWPVGDGRCGILEGHSSSMFADGSQPIRWSLRADCNSESAMALAMHGLVDRSPQSSGVASNLLDFVYTHSALQQGPRGDPRSPSYGLLGWDTRPGSIGVYYGDDNAKAMLATMAASAALHTERWDEPLLRCLLGNFRTCGLLGFRSGALGEADLKKQGWQTYFHRRFINCSPHYESWLWACYLWLYDKTRYEPLHERAAKGIRLMMQGYPNRWSWVNGQQQIERSRMILPLAWLVRVDDTPEHRKWLRFMADELLAHQDASGAIQERLAWALKSNEQYGTCEISLLQENGDPLADMIYTCNFALLGLNEAAAATGDAKIARAADRLAEFLVRIQIRSDAHPELDGGWYRGFDFRRWEYWGSNGDNGWGTWCTETGWTQGWIVAGLALRHAKTSLWEMSKESKIARHFEKYRKAMIPDEALVPAPSAAQLPHAALGKSVTLAVEADSRYPACGPDSLTDGLVGKPGTGSPEWLGFEGDSLEAVVDLGSETPIRRLGANFLQVVSMGVFLPTSVEFAASHDGRTFRPLGTVRNEIPAERKGDLTKTFALQPKDVTARYVKVRAANLGTIPAWHGAKGRKAWLFVDEIVVNPTK
jgi:hypothetical protein